MDVKDVDGKIYHLNRGSLSNWLLANNGGIHGELNNAKKKSMFNVTESAMGRWLDGVLKKKSPSLIIRIAEIKDKLGSKEWFNKKINQLNEIDAFANLSLDDKGLPGEIAKLKKELAKLEAQRHKKLS